MINNSRRNSTGNTSGKNKDVDIDVDSIYKNNHTLTVINVPLIKNRFTLNAEHPGYFNTNAYGEIKFPGSHATMSKVNQ